MNKIIDSMKRTKPPTPNKDKKRSLASPEIKPGPNSKLDDTMIEEAYRLALLGFDNEQIAGVLQVPKVTLTYWYKTNPTFKQALDKGRAGADGDVALSLYQKAKGWDEEVTEITYDIEKDYDRNGNVIKEVKIPKTITYIKHHAPDNTAIKKWLSSRHRELWGESIKVDHRHAVLFANGINIHSVIEQIEQNDLFDDQELEEIAKEGFAEQQQKQIQQSDAA